MGVDNKKKAQEEKKNTSADSIVIQLPVSHFLYPPWGDKSLFGPHATQTPEKLPFIQPSHTQEPD